MLNYLCDACYAANAAIIVVGLVAASTADRIPNGLFIVATGFVTCTTAVGLDLHLKSKGGRC